MKKENKKEKTEEYNTEHQHDIPEGTPAIVRRQKFPIDDYGQQSRQGHGEICNVCTDGEDHNRQCDIYEKRSPEKENNQQRIVDPSNVLLDPCP